MIPEPDFAQAPLRDPAKVMRLSRMGAFHPTRLSFMRTLIRRLNAEQAQVTRPLWEMNYEGFGRAVYSVDVSGYTYSLVAFSTPLAPENRTDRVIAEAWDSTFVLFDGVPTTEDLDRIEGNAPKQEAGRFSAKELVLSRANKSVRLFAHVVDRLAAGEQPDADQIASIGYLMRTTAVYGNGKFGIADRVWFAGRPSMSGPFRAEMLTVWLIRGYTHDLVEHVAKARNPDAATLDPTLKRHLGIGNSTGLGMAPFLVNHPILLNNWMTVRETAFARVCAIETPDAEAVARFQSLLTRAQTHVADWNVPDERQQARTDRLREELAEIAARPLAAAYPWADLANASEQWSEEAQEVLVSLMLEPYGDLIDGLEDCMASDTETRLDPGMTVADLHDLLADKFDWALAVDFDDPEQQRKFWYASEEKLEPRIGDRYEEDGADLEEPLDIARDVQRLAAALDGADGGEIVARFLMAHPELRRMTRRVQSIRWAPYSEIQDNLISADCLPIDMLRCKLSFFGASKFDPKSDLWTRVTLFQGAPVFEDVSAMDADDWSFPVMGTVGD